MREVQMFLQQDKNDHKTQGNNETFALVERRGTTVLKVQQTKKHKRCILKAVINWQTVLVNVYLIF
jgi:hypothetical protein